MGVTFREDRLNPHAFLDETAWLMIQMSSQTCSWVSWVSSFPAAPCDILYNSNVEDWVQLSGSLGIYCNLAVKNPMTHDFSISFQAFYWVPKKVANTCKNGSWGDQLFPINGCVQICGIPKLWWLKSSLSQSTLPFCGAMWGIPNFQTPKKEAVCNICNLLRPWPFCAGNSHRLLLDPCN